MEKLRKYLKTAFNWKHTVYAAVVKKLGDLKSENAALRCKYGDLTKELKRLYELVIECINTLSCPPVYEKSVILAELRERYKKEKFDPENDARFPHVIDYLNQLNIWFQSVDTKLNKTFELFKKVERETKVAIMRAYVVQREAKSRKNIVFRLGAATGTPLTVGGGVMVVGGLLLGGLLVPIGGAAALIGGAAVLIGTISSANSFKAQERESKKMGDDIFEINHAAQELNEITEVVERKKDAICYQRDIVCAPRPLLFTLRNSLKDLSELIESLNFDKERRDAKKIFDTAYKP